MGMRVTVVLPLLAACGRIGFDGLGDASVVAPPVDAVTLPVDPHPVASGVVMRCSDLVWNGSDLAVVWVDERDATMSGRLYFARAAPDGNVLAPEQLFGTPGEFVSCPKATAVGATYGVAWHMNLSEDVFMAIVDAAGVVVQESTVANSGPNETSPTIAFDGSVVGVAYGFHNGANSSLRFRPFTAAGAPLANPKDVTTADVGQGAIASSNDGFTIVHVLGQFQSAGAETFAIDVTGAPTSAGVMALAPSEPIGALAFTDDGTHYAIVYQAAAATVATGDRTTANPPHALGTRNPETLDVVSAPGGFAVAWIEDGELLFARVDVAGVLATPVFHLAGDAHGAALAALGGTTFAAVYGDAGGQLLLVVFDA